MGNLWESIEAEWSRIPKDLILNLVESMPDRVQDVISNMFGRNISIILII